MTALIMRIGGSLASILSVWLLARVLSPAELGLYSGFLAVTSVLALPASAGLPLFLTRELAAMREQGKHEQILPTIRAGLRSWALVSAIAILLLLGLAAISFPVVFTWHHVLILSVAIPLLSLDLIRAGTMRGLDSALRSQIPEVLIRPLVLAFMVTLVAVTSARLSVSESLLAFVVACVVSATVGQVLLRPYLRSLPSGPKISTRKVFQQSFGIGILGATNTFISNLDLLILSSLSQLNAAGDYRVALQGVVALLLVHNTVSSIGLRDLASAVGRNDLRRIQNASDRVTLLSTTGTGAAWVVIVVAGSPTIDFLFGHAYHGAYGILVTLGLGYLLSAALGPSQDILVLSKRQKVALRVNLLGIALTAVAAVLAVPSWGGTGMAIASATGLIVRKGLMSFLIMRMHDFDPTLFGAFRRLFQQTRNRSIKNLPPNESEPITDQDEAKFDEQ